MKALFGIIFAGLLAATSAAPPQGDAGSSDNSAYVAAVLTVATQNVADADTLETQIEKNFTTVAKKIDSIHQSVKGTSETCNDGCDDTSEDDESLDDLKGNLTAACKKINNFDSSICAVNSYLKTASNLLANNNSLPATIQKLKISSIQAKNNATNNKLGVYKDICNSTATEIKNLKAAANPNSLNALLGSFGIDLSSFMDLNLGALDSTGNTNDSGTSQMVVSYEYQQVVIINGASNSTNTTTTPASNAVIL